MSSEKEMKIRERLEEVRRKLMVMEWDQSRNQLNPGRLGIFNELKEEKARLEIELSQIANLEEQTTEANSELNKTE